MNWFMSGLSTAGKAIQEAWEIANPMAIPAQTTNAKQSKPKDNSHQSPLKAGSPQEHKTPASSTSKAKPDFTKIRAKAMEQGSYKGKSMQPGQGGRARLLYDELVAQGKTHEQAKGIVGMQARRKGLAPGG